MHFESYFAFQIALNYLFLSRQPENNSRFHPGPDYPKHKYFFYLALLGRISLYQHQEDSNSEIKHLKSNCPINSFD